MFISEAFAQTTSQTAGAVQAAAPMAGNMAGGGGQAALGWIPYALIILVFYILILRPQQQKVQTHQKMLSELKPGDRVITTGGLFGTIRQIAAEESDVTLEIATGVSVRVQKSAIADKAPEKAA